MDNKDFQRALIAIVVSFLVLIGYQYFFVKPTPRVEKPGKVVQQVRPHEKASKPAVTEKQAIPQKIHPVISGNLQETLVKVETPLYIAEFSSRGGVIKKWELKKYRTKQGAPIFLSKGIGDILPLALGTDTEFNLSSINFKIIGGNLKLNKKNPHGVLTFVYNSGGISIRRTMKFYADSCRVDLTDDVKGIGDYWITLGEHFGITGAEGYRAHIGPVILMGTDRKEYKPSKLKEPVLLTPVDLKWAADEDMYFFAALVPLTEVSEVKLWSRQNSGLVAFKVKAGKSQYVLYAGPKVIDELKPLNLGLENIVDFGFFSIIARPIFWLLKYINKLIGNYGWSIIVLTILLRVPFIPLLNKGQKSMKKMQALQPRMAEIKEKYKKDPQKMQKEMMAMYKKYKVNPMGGCLPMLVQIPVFFALYKVLLVAIEMRDAPWILWIQDLSAKDPIYVLPIIMGATMFLQQKMTPTSADPKQAKIMMFMPIIFTFMFLNFPSGLVLYWLMSNLLSIIQQFFVNKKLAAEEAAS
ncbi:membrane protein insertase YidC [bacterium BMS3Abin07]|nr:membrane protein insertase YidC [bacterium BMS3Abin07]GBE32391.1 membrane protein insertase YidC [bacterium BMS3Bbin05]HDL20094.1 membrane protein insertase YidC [Nitrospirota bacterium]HDO22442.1 membrane protein insertase YidC [Nitrospirota bacterium]HDZ87484.1 membrane protein insertase YidC [Nitrospirota bacterium]